MTLTTNGTGALTPHDQLQVRLSDPKILDALNRLLDRAELLALSADALDGFIRRGDEITDSVGGIVADLRQSGAPPELMEVAGKLPQLARASVQLANTVDKPEFTALLSSGLLEQLGKPGTIESLKLILSKIDLIAFAVQAVDGFMQRGDVITDNIGESLGDLRKLSSGVDFDKLSAVAAQVPDILKAGEELMNSGILEKIKKLTEAGALVADSGLLDPPTVAVLARAGKTAATSYIEAQAAPRTEIKGIFGLLGALKDPEVQRVLSFFVEFLKRYSQKMK